MLIPAGCDTRLKVSVLAGRSESLAVFVTTRVLSSVIDWLSATVRTGALFTSVTMTLKLLVALKGGAPLSVTTVIIVFVPGPSASFGVKVLKPLASIFAHAGGDTNWSVIPLAGMSASLAVLVTTNVVNSFIGRPV